MLYSVVILEFCYSKFCCFDACLLNVKSPLCNSCSYYICLKMMASTPGSLFAKLL